MIVQKLEQISLQFHVPLSELLKETSFSYASFMRWKGRIAKGRDPVQRPGPKKVEAFDLRKLKDEIKQLNHRRKRTHQTAAVYEGYKDCVSRRTLRALIAEARSAQRKQQADCLQRIRWHHPGLAWALDDFKQQEELWPRYTMNATPITFDNDVEYKFYQILFQVGRANNDGLMQIAEIELRTSKY